MTITKHRAMLKKCYKRIKVMDEIDSHVKYKKNLKFIDIVKNLRAEGGGDHLDKLLNGLIKDVCDDRRDLRSDERQKLRKLLCNGDKDAFQERLDNADARILFLRTRLLTDLKF
jgi:hypothetical protein